MESSEKSYSIKIALVSTLWFLIMLFWAAAATAQTVDDAWKVETFTVSGTSTAKLQTSGGFLKLIGSSGNQVHVNVIVTKRGKRLTNEDPEVLKEWDIEISKSGNDISAIATRKSNKWSGSSMAVSFEVYAPTNTQGTLKTSGGSITMANLAGNQMARTSGGSMTARSVTGDLSLRTSGGSITMEDVSGKIAAHTSGGSIRATITEVAETVDVSTSGGSITLSIPKDGGYDLDLSGTRLDVNLVNFSGSSSKRSVSGTMNGGGTFLKARTSGGTVSLKYI